MKMASLDGLPPLPKSLSGLNLVDYHVFTSESSQPPTYSLSIEKSTALCENSSGKNYSLGSENGNFIPTSIRSYSGSSASGESVMIAHNRSTPPLRDILPTLSFKQLTDQSLVGSSRASPILNSSRTTPLNSARGSPIASKSSTSPVSGFRGSTPPGTRGLPPPPPPPPPPRQYHSSLQNGFDKNQLGQQPRSGRMFNLDTQLANLKKEMFSLRQMDLSLLNQLWSLNEAIQEFHCVQEENAALSPPSPASCDDSDEFYSPLSSRGYQNISMLQLNPFSGRFDSSSSSSDTSIEFGDV